MEIVVLDGHTLNPGDLSWESLEELGRLTVYPRTAPNQVRERANGAQMLLTNKVILDRELILELPDLKYIGVLATGVNVVDVEAARQRGIPVTNVPGYSTPSVAQTVFALLLELAQHVAHHGHLVRLGHWCEAEDFSFWDRPLVELSGLTMGIVGFGRIGQRVARIASSFGMTVLVHTSHPEKRRDAGLGEEVRFVPLEELLGTSDVVSLHCPLTPQTERMIDSERIALMKKSAFLINTGRGPLIDEADLAEALKAGRLAGAGLDVLSQEPPPRENPLLALTNCFITPHQAWATKASRQRLMAEVAANVKAFQEGAPRNVVNPTD
ncbi:MAG: glycerate dehydrogenase [Desulfuromonas sp.]|uniref:D-2-hydroxyacid dehydrogenase n=1 Tax=Desulfuromonas sp. TaxID=892 RepID=UPI000CB9198F|nr:D-2-hydroxyacid dehydrogenase [Desulfuromonas sp.]PLX86330.1 MAG: glycerate dehydrogenase [Desulfuromonas sp.]